MSKWMLQTEDPGMPGIIHVLPCESLRHAVVQAIKEKWRGQIVVRIGCPDGKILDPADIARWRLEHRHQPMA